MKHTYFRPAVFADAKPLLEIYTPYVENTAISFEYEVPSLEEFQERIEHISQHFPYIVAEQDGQIVGYAYASHFSPRQGYDHSAELSIYVDLNHKRSGIGRALYEELERQLIDRGFLNLYARIAYPEKEDEHLNRDSIKFHSRMGFLEAAHFHRCAHKFGQWYDSIIMEKMLGKHRSIRTAAIADLDAVSAVEAACFPPAEAATKEEFQDRLAAYGNHFLLMHEDGDLIAFIDGFVTDEADLTDEMYADASLHNENGAWQMIFGLNTLPEYRNRGYAGELIQQMIQLAKNQNRKGLVLTCKEKLVHYYAKFGFVNEGITEQSTHGGVVWYQMRLTF